MLIALLVQSPSLSTQFVLGAVHKLDNRIIDPLFRAWLRAELICISTARLMGFMHQQRDSIFLEAYDTCTSSCTYMGRRGAICIRFTLKTLESIRHCL